MEEAGAGLSCSAELSWCKAHPHSQIYPRAQLQTGLQLPQPCAGNASMLNSPHDWVPPHVCPEQPFPSLSVR